MFAESIHTGTENRTASKDAVRFSVTYLTLSSVYRWTMIR